MAREKSGWFYLLTHPTDTIKTIGLRAETQVLDDVARTNYLGIPLADAVKAVVKNKPKSTGNAVLSNEWPGTVQDEMKEGQVVHPDGRRPEHPNV